MTPAVETFDDTMRQARRVIVRGQHAAEDAAAATTLIIRRRPFAAMMIAGGMGAVAGALIGFGFIALTRHRENQ